MQATITFVQGCMLVNCRVIFLSDSAFYFVDKTRQQALIDDKHVGCAVRTQIVFVSELQ